MAFFVLKRRIMAASTDKFFYAAPLWTGAIGASGVSDNSTTTVPLSSATGLTNGRVYAFTIDRVDGVGTKTPTKREVCIGLLSGTDFINCSRGEEGTAQAHSAGAVVEVLMTAAQWNRMIGGLLAEHAADGTHDSTFVKTTASQTLTNKTLTSPTVNSPVINTPDIDLGSDATGDIYYRNSGTHLARLGIGTSGKFLTSDGTLPQWSTFYRNVVIQVVAGPVSLTTGDGKFYFTIPEDLNGANLVGVHARVVTAGTTGTTDIQIANVTDSVDMLSTKLTIDSAETGSDTAATSAVIDTTKDDVATNDLLRIDIDAISTTAPKGLVLRLRFALP